MDDKELRQLVDSGVITDEQYAKASVELQRKRYEPAAKLLHGFICQQHHNLDCRFYTSVEAANLWQVATKKLCDELEASPEEITKWLQEYAEEDGEFSKFHRLVATILGPRCSPLIDLFAIDSSSCAVNVPAPDPDLDLLPSPEASSDDP